MNMHNIIKSNDIKYNYYRQKFLETFGVPLKQFYHHLLAFDVVAFDEWLQVPSGVSTAQFLNDKYGTEAREMVEHLL